MPLYTMIAHTTMPYGHALQRSRRQESIIAFTATVALVGLCGIGVWFAKHH
jgi:kynurenine 3-monooxygenase